MEGTKINDMLMDEFDSSFNVLQMAIEEFDLLKDEEVKKFQ